MPYVMWGGGLPLLVLIVWALVVRSKRRRVRAIEAKKIALTGVSTPPALTCPSGRRPALPQTATK